MQEYTKLLINFGAYLSPLECAALRTDLQKRAGLEGYTIMIIQVQCEIDYRGGATEQAQRIIDEVQIMLGGTQPDYIILPQGDGIMAMRLKREFPYPTDIVVVDAGILDTIVEQ
jgi:hypothetical protein